MHYAYTLDHWLRRTQKARTKIVALYDERFYRMWEFYLAGGVVAFENGSMCNFQVQYVRNRTAVPITRDYMIEAERSYRAMDSVSAPKSRPKRGRKAASMKITWPTARAQDTWSVE